MNNNRYISEVNELINKLRAHLLGQDAQFKELIPDIFLNEPNEKKANYLADRILFALSRMDDWFPQKELQRARNWLYEGLLFLMLECSEDDHNFANLIKIFNLAPATRMAMFQPAKRKTLFPHLAQERTMPMLLEDLELSLLELLPMYHAIADYDALSTFL